MLIPLRSGIYKLRLGLLLSIGILVATSVAPIPVSAQQLSQRSLAIANVNPSASTTHSFSFSYVDPTPVAAVVFEYCTSPLIQFACVAPAGLDAAGAVLAQQTGETGYVLSDAQANRLTLSRAVAVAPLQNPSGYVFDNVVNPSDLGTFYVRISTHSLPDASDAHIDFGAVVNTTTKGVFISSEVPPILKFCVGLTIANDCTTAEGNVVELGDLSTARASSGVSQMLAATNAEFGLAIAVYGTTLTSGTNVIPALQVPTVSAPGNAQFGFNLRKNTNPSIGEDPAGIGIANPTSSYATANAYTFNSGDVVATSPDATDSRKFTSSYIVNVPSDQAPGVYTATLTYICTATF